MKLSKKLYNKYDAILFILLTSLAAGSLSGVWQLPRTFSVLFFFVLVSNYTSTRVVRNVLRFFLFWIVWAFISLMWTSDFSNGIHDCIILFTNFLLFFEIIFFAERSKNLSKILYTGWGAAFLITAIIGVWEIITGSHLSTSKFGNEAQMISDGQYIIHNYAAATFVNFNSYVVFICYSVPFLLYGYFNSNKIRGKLICLMLFLASVFILFMNASRGGMLALIIQISFFFLPLFLSKGAKGTILVILLLLTCVLIVFWDVISVYVMIRAAESSSFQDEARYDIWVRALNCFWPTFGIGTGVGSIMASMRAISSSGAVIIPHNAVLEILVQFGLVICFICLRFVYRLLRLSRKIQIQQTKALVMSSIFSLPAILIIDSSYLISPAFWGFFASLFSLVNRQASIKTINGVNK